MGLVCVPPITMGTCKNYSVVFTYVAARTPRDEVEHACYYCGCLLQVALPHDDGTDDSAWIDLTAITCPDCRRKWDERVLCAVCYRPLAHHLA